VAARRASPARGRIVVNEATCKGCELCAAVCPYDLIRAADHYNAKGYRPAMLLDPVSLYWMHTVCYDMPRCSHYCLSLSKGPIIF
jgi:Fe-S-cluster-containing hydrogenase component 2